MKGYPVLKLQRTKRLLSLVALSAAALFYAGCGGGNGGESSGSSTTSTSATVLSGQFLDGPTQRLEYRTESQSGTETDANGQFLYSSGETITFYLGGLPLGSTTAKTVITPADLVEGGYVEQEQVINLTRFLQTLDVDGNSANGIEISSQAQTQAAVHFPEGQDYTAFFKSGGLNGGFGENGQATNRLKDYFTAAGIDGQLVPTELAMNHLRGTIRGLTEKWTVTLTPSGNTTILSKASGSLALSLAHTAKETQTSGQFVYHDPDDTPLASGTLTLTDLIVPVVKTVTEATGTTPAVTESTTTSGTLTVPINGATVAVKDLGNGKARLTITKLAGGSADAEKATITLGDTTITPGLSVASSEYTTLVLQATVEVATGALSDTTFSVQFSETTWSSDLGLYTANGSWSLSASSGGTLFREMYRGVSSTYVEKGWALYGIRKNAVESSAEVTGRAYVTPSSNRRNLVLIDSGTDAVNTSYPMPAYIGFTLYLFDPAIQLDQVLLAGTALADAGAVTITTASSDVVLPNFGILDMSSEESDPQVALTANSDGKTWSTDSTAVGPGTFSTVFTTSLIADGAGYQFKELASADQLTLVLVKVSQ